MWNEPVPGHFEIRNEPVPGQFEITKEPVPGHLEIRNEPVPGHFEIRNEPVRGQFEITKEPVPGHLEIRNEPVPGHFEIRNEPVPDHFYAICFEISSSVFRYNYPINYQSCRWQWQSVVWRTVAIELTRYVRPLITLAHTAWPADVSRTAQLHQLPCTIVRYKQWNKTEYTDSKGTVRNVASSLCTSNP